MKHLILFIFCGLSLLWSEPKVVGIFGGENCPWSDQLRRDVWESSSFQALLASAEIVKEERTASKEPETPLLILYSAKGEEVGRLGFLVIPPEKYVSLFKEMLAIHELCQNIDKLNVSQLLQFYRKCQVLNMKACEQKILKAGIAKDKGTDFLIEHYAKVCRDHPRQAQKIKAEIRARKPESSSVEWQLALVSFQSNIEKKKEVDQIVKPLKKYLRRYGDQDPDNRWRCHLILAEFYKDKSVMDKARLHADRAIADAPTELKQMIAPLGIE